MPINHTHPVTLSFDEVTYLGAEYPKSHQLANDLGFDANRVDVRMLGSKDYRITSLATYLDSSMVAEQAQRIAEQSKIALAVREQRVTGAVFGVEEVETMYRRWIGGYGEWPAQPEERTEFFADQAFRLTLAHALDVAGFRSYLGLTEEQLPDAQALQELHEIRATSTAIPSGAREESREWLKERGLPLKSE